MICLEEKGIKDLEPWQDLQNYIKTGHVSPAFEDVCEKFSCKRVLEIEEGLRG
jgi:Anaphase-promoting complex, cyclosome, subunit 4